MGLAAARAVCPAQPEAGMATEQATSRRSGLRADRAGNRRQAGGTHAAATCMPAESERSERPSAACPPSGYLPVAGELAVDISPRSRRRFRRSLAGWARGHLRTYPWRSTADPYAVLVAEMLLRKTRADDAVPIYDRVMARWPTLESMAAATPGGLARVIAPIGLPSRARAMRDAALAVVTLHHGKVPDEEQDLLALPGVGRYISNAVLCFAHGRRVALVDGGVGRLLRRVFGLTSRKPAYCDGALWDLADAMLPPRSAKRHNLALLDLAAILCRPHRPSCGLCPLRSLCCARGVFAQ